MSFSIQFSGAQRVEKNLRKLGDEAKEVLSNALKIVTLELSGYVKEKKLSGNVLKVRTGRLRNSITPEVRSVLGVLQGRVGTNVFYGKIHELGLGHQTEKKFLRSSLKENEKKIIATVKRVVAKAVKARS